VLGIPRGGVIVAAEVARALNVPLDVWLSRKIGAPGNPELAIDSVTEHGEVLDQATIGMLGVTSEYLEQAIRRERAELERRLVAFRGEARAVSVEGKRVLLVDDGAATGSTALAALEALQQEGAIWRLVALPVAPQGLLPKLRDAADEVLVLEAEPVFSAVGGFYQDFRTVGDDEVLRALQG